MKKFSFIIVLIICILSLTFMIKNIHETQNNNNVSYGGNYGSNEGYELLQIDTITVCGGGGGCTGRAIYHNLSFEPGHTPSPQEALIGNHGGTVVFVKDSVVFSSKYPRSGGGMISVIKINTRDQ